jgi:hypothetical protein
MFNEIELSDAELVVVNGAWGGECDRDRDRCDDDDDRRRGRRGPVFYGQSEQQHSAFNLNLSSVFDQSENSILGIL